jgi:hypothetical protein
LYSQRDITEQELISALAKNKLLIDAYYVNREKYRPDYHLSDGAFTDARASEIPKS